MDRLVGTPLHHQPAELVDQSAFVSGQLVDRIGDGSVRLLFSGVGDFGSWVVWYWNLVGASRTREIIEFVAGAAMAGKRGASRRAMALAVLGTMVGSIVGALFTIPIPIIGPVVGVLAGGAGGAFVGAWLGELWKGKTAQEGMHVGTGAMLGRLLGTSGKLIVGALMCVVAAIDAFY